MADQQATRPDGIPGSPLAGPFAVGSYAKKLQERLRAFQHVQLFGEVCNVRTSRAKVYWELRDGSGALPCAMWRNEHEALGLPDGAFGDGAQVVVSGGCDYYAGSAQSSPHFHFAVKGLRIAGEGDLLAQVAELRRRLLAEGLDQPQRALARPHLPKVIGVVTGEGGKARDDVLAGLRRRGWHGRVVWAFCPVQDRHAAPRITRALQDLASVGDVEVIVVARGGGSVADLMGFSDETLCRTVALLPVPVIASIGHHTDRTVLDDVAAVSCSTPTHAAETAVPLHCDEARAALRSDARRLAVHGRRAVLVRARALASYSQAPARVVARQRARLHQLLREVRASARRAFADGERDVSTRARVLSRKAGAAARGDAGAQRRRLDALSAALTAHDPGRIVERGYALVDDGDGGVVTSAAEARAAGTVRLFFSDDQVRARIEGDDK
jgi:exodeoxyribonuclease VII large subunit